MLQDTGLPSFIQVISICYRNGAYRPKRRLMNEYVDDVFESDDSGGSRTLRLPLATIPEKSDSDSPESPNSPVSAKS